jgi:hypothetical protein
VDLRRALLIDGIGIQARWKCANLGTRVISLLVDVRPELLVAMRVDFNDIIERILTKTDLSAGSKVLYNYTA